MRRLATGVFSYHFNADRITISTYLYFDLAQAEPGIIIHPRITTRLCPAILDTPHFGRRAPQIIVGAED